MHALSVLLNVTGRFSLAKVLGTSGTLNICLALGFYLVIKILMESLFLQLETNKFFKEQDLVSYMDFKIAQKKFKGVLINISCNVVAGTHKKFDY